MFGCIILLLFYCLSNIFSVYILPSSDIILLFYRYGDFSHLIMEEILNNRNSTKTITFKPFYGSGFGNHIRGMEGLLLISIINNARMCIDYDAYFEVMHPSLSILRCNSIQIRYIDLKTYHSMITNMSCMPFVSEQSIVVTTYESVYSYLLNCDNIKLLLNEKGLWRDDFTKKMAQYLFHLNFNLRHYADSVLKTMQGLKIGIQLRFGGSVANTRETDVFLNVTNFNTTLENIKSILGRYQDNHTIFLSTDSNKTLSLLAPLNERIVTADHFALGHTYVNGEFLERTVIDLYLISHCDVIIRTFRSSYGDLAVRLANTNDSYVIK